MPVGAYYYPEHWPENQWERDLKKMGELGFEFTHFGEFAWAMMEPEEGVYDFEWLDKVIELADQNGLKVILCTPTPTPPAWLTEKHPEILTVDANGITQYHGSRLHVSYNHPTYLHYVAKIIIELGKRYGKDKRIWGWQLDNEPHYGVLYDYSENHEKNFRAWLRQKYHTIDALNKTWGTAFWSQVYNHFDQIHIPNKSRAPQGANPHALVDFQHFNAQELAAALRFQEQTLRNYIDPKQWITTNYAYFKFLPSVDPFLNKGDLDYAAHTMYLTSQYLSDEGGALAHRLGSGMELSFSQEFAASVNGYTGIMELQPGQINWGVFNPQPLPGAVRMWIWHAFALGDRFACTYRFRQPLFGSEQTHKGIIDTDGVTVTRGGQEYVQTIKELKSLLASYKPGKGAPADYLSRKTAFLWKQENLWDMENHKHHADWDSWKHFYTYYQTLKRLGAPITFVQAGDQLDPKEYPFLVVPACQITSKALIQQWEDYATRGGHLIISVRTGMKAPNGHLWEAKLQEPIWPLIGANIQYYDHLPANKHGKISMEDKTFSWHTWGDILEAEPNTEIWASYADQFYKGAPSVIHRKLGQGSVTYIGAWSDHWDLEYAALRKVYQEAGAIILDQPDYVFTEYRDGFWVTVNYSSEVAEAPIHEGAEILFGETMVKPGQVVVWKNK